MPCGPRRSLLSLAASVAPVWGGLRGDQPEFKNSKESYAQISPNNGNHGPGLGPHVRGSHAQSTAPTISSVAITSNPGTDNTYAAGDTITATLTFSEAVSVDTANGTPRITLDIGGQPRYAAYSGDGSSAAAQAFSYTALVSDTDTDGVSVLANSLALDGGTIEATDDSANAALTHSDMTFANHKVDTQAVLLSNLNQADASPLTISATQSVVIDLEGSPQDWLHH